MADVQPDHLEPSPRVGIPLEVSALTVILALALGLMAAAGAALYQRNRPTQYLSFSVLQIDQPLVIAQDVTGAALFKLQRLRTYYSDVLNTEQLAQRIAGQVKLSTAKIEASVSTINNPSNFVTDVVARSSSPQQAQSIAQAATSELISYVAKQQSKIGIQAVAQVAYHEVTQPALGAKVSTSRTKALVSGGVAFVAVAAIFIIVADLVRRRW